MNTAINQLIQYALKEKMIQKEDVDYSVNLLLELLKEDSFTKETVKDIPCHEILEILLDKVIEKGLIENNITSRDLFDTRIMNCIMPRPSEVVKQFQSLYKESSQKATDYYYHLSIDSNYIRKTRTDKNIKFNHYEKYGEIQITINLSKPEKDPAEIAKAKLVKSSGYPQCLLCKENVGYAGTLNHPARQTHRIIPLSLDGDDYYFQYSPYVYYNEHCIIFNKNHIPMAINKDTFRHLFSFVEQFPHYMLGSNADLPIVGGSILSHDHYQGGHHHFPIEDASTIDTFTIDAYQDVCIEMVNWPLSTLRLTSKDKDQLISLSDDILHHWIDYNDESLDILAYSGETRHNTITPIARKKDGQFQIDLVLRNNRTTDQYPDGIFHPHQEHHHIKKENIGLIEVMGLAVLPARLKDELQLLKECLSNQRDIHQEESLQKHLPWFEYLKQQDYDNIDTFIEKEVTKKFVSVLEDAGVYKMNDEGIEGMRRFVNSLIETYHQ